VGSRWARAGTRLRKGTVDSARGAPRLAADALATVTPCGAPQPRYGVTKVVHSNAATGPPVPVGVSFSVPVTETPWLQTLADRSNWPHAMIATCVALTRPSGGTAALARHA